MGAITVRRLDDRTIAALKAQAEAAGRSMEEEVRRILEEATRDSAAVVDRAQRLAYIERLRRTRKELFGDRILPSSVELLRELRDEDRLSDPTADRKA